MKLLQEWRQEKPELRQALWTALTTIYLGGMVLYFAGVRPQSGLAREVIPVHEPTAIDWAEIGGILFLT